MLFTRLILLFPAVSLASWLPIKPRHEPNADSCTLTSTLSPITVTSIHPTSTVGISAPGEATGGGSLIYTTAYPTLGPDGPGLHTYTITAPCSTSRCVRPASGDCPPGFTTTAVVCRACGDKAVTTVLTLPIESATAIQGSGSGGIPKGDHGSTGKDGNENIRTLTAFVTTTGRKTIFLGNAKPTDSLPSPQDTTSDAPQGPGSADTPKQPQAQHPGSAKPLNSDAQPAIPEATGSPASKSNTNPDSATMDSPNEVPTSAGAEGWLEVSFSAYPSSEASPGSPTAVVVTGRAAGDQITWTTLLKAVGFAVMVLYPIYA